MSRSAVAKETSEQVIELLRGGKSVHDGFVKGMSFVLKTPKIFCMTPHGDYDAANIGCPPDFSEIENWIAHPGRARGVRAVEDANHLAAAMKDLPAIDQRPADCFFVVDTCFNQPEAFKSKTLRHTWNLPLGSAEGSFGRKLSNTVLEQMQMRVAAGASCFNRTCRVYAPAYRQVAVGALLNMEALVTRSEYPEMKSMPLSYPLQLQQALQTAYEDVRRAFVQFVDDPANTQRPFIIAGHSQGTMHLVRLLQEEIEPYPLRRERFVHGYLAGFGVPLDLFQDNLRVIKPSESAFDICSVSSWRTAAPRHIDHKTTRSATYYLGKGWRKPSAPLLACNPITWSQGSGASMSGTGEYLGAMWPLPQNLDLGSENRFRTSGSRLRYVRLGSKTQEVLGAIAPALVEVDCGPITAQVSSDGLVRVPHVSESCIFALTERDWLLYHDIDMALFHNNLQANAACRVEAWRTNMQRQRGA